MKKSILAAFAAAGFTSFGAPTASAMPIAPSAAPISHIEQVQMICNAWGRCWWRPNDDDRYGYYRHDQDDRGYRYIDDDDDQGGYGRRGYYGRNYGRWGNQGDQGGDQGDQGEDED